MSTKGELVVTDRMVWKVTGCCSLTSLVQSAGRGGGGEGEGVTLSAAVQTPALHVAPDPSVVMQFTAWPQPADPATGTQ